MELTKWDAESNTWLHGIQISPLFETISDLEKMPESLENLLGVHSYRYKLHPYRELHSRTRLLAFEIPCAVLVCILKTVNCIRPQTVVILHSFFLPF